MQEYASTSQLHLSLNLPPQNPTCKSMPQPHSFTSPRLLVTIPSHFLNLPPKTLHARVFLNFTASPIQDFLLDSKSFSKPPPKTLHARVCLNFTDSPLQDFLGGGSGCGWIGAPVQRKKHADSCGFIRDYRFHPTRSIWLPTETCHFADSMGTE